jgi:hypothetical protein
VTVTLQEEPARQAPKAAPVPAPTPVAVPSLAETHAAAEAPSTKPEREMFSGVKEPRRFSFFRGARG